MESSFTTRPTFLSRLKNSLSLLNFLVIIWMASSLWFLWYDLPPLIQRRGLLLLVFFIYCKFRAWFKSNFICDLLQILKITFLFNFVRKTEGNYPKAFLDNFWSFESIVFRLYSLIVDCFDVAIIGYFILAILFFIKGRPQNPLRDEEDGIHGMLLEALKVVHVTKDNEMRLLENNGCPICLEDYYEGEKLIELPICLHKFHKKCIETWLQENCDCPYCRADIKENIKEIQREQERLQISVELRN